MRPGNVLLTSVENTGLDQLCSYETGINVTEQQVVETRPMSPKTHASADMARSYVTIGSTVCNSFDDTLSTATAENRAHHHDNRLKDFEKLMISLSQNSRIMGKTRTWYILNTNRSRHCCDKLCNFRNSAPD